MLLKRINGARSGQSGYPASPSPPLPASGRSKTDRDPFRIQTCIPDRWRDSSTPSERHVKPLMAFLNSVIAPLIARDRELSAQEGGALWLVRATKRGKLNVDMPPANLMQRAICPVCRSAMAFTVDSVRCTSCAIQFPVVNDIPIIAIAYLNFFKELMDEKH
jgi:hypothetical protein